MIQLANDPNANRAGWRAAPSGAKAAEIDGQRQRLGHAWPFPSRYSERLAQHSPKPAANDAGS